jgi:suppressor of ftsI
VQRIIRIATPAALAALLAACGGGSSGTTPWVPPNPASSNVAMPQAPVVQSVHGVATVELETVVSQTTGLPAFEYQGRDGVAPTIEVKPGDTIVVDVRNELPGGGMQYDMNLHFHGLTVSPLAPADDVLTMLAMPGNTLHYVVPIPKSQEPGLYWYHPHVHGQTNYQVGESGMSGAIIIDGLQQHIPALAAMRQQVIVVRDVSNSAAVAVPGAESETGAMGMPATPHRVKPMDVDHNTDPCGADPADLHFTVNGIVRPTIVMKPGESQFFRVVNATGHRNLALQVDGSMLQVVAIDGVALDAYPGTPATLTTKNFVLPPAGRVEFVATAPTSGGSEFRTLCYNSGPNGDPDPASILADIRPSLTAASASRVQAVHRIVSLRVGAPLPRNALSSSLPPIAAQRIVRFTEDTNGFYINGQYFTPNAAPMFTVHTGTVEQWTVANLTEEVHDFHIHQVHFLVQSINGQPVTNPHWADSFVVPPRRPTINGAFLPGTIVAIVDFRNPVIRGTFVFHCHILDHEDAGMMAKIQAI